MGLSKKLFPRKGEADRVSTSTNTALENDKEYLSAGESKRKINILESQIQDMSADKQQCDEKISFLVDELHKQQAAAKQHGDEVSRRDEIIGELQQSLSRAEEQKKQLEALGMGRQKDALQSLVTNKWHAPKEDRYVRDELSKLNDKLRQWARNTSVAKYSDLDRLAKSEKDLVVQYLSGYCGCDDWTTLVNKIPAPKDRIPPLLVQAALAKELHEKLFTDPFFVFDAIDGDKVVPGPEEMRTLQDSMAKASESTAHIWRSQTIRSLSTPGFNSDATSTDASHEKPFLIARLDPLCRRFATDFLRGPVRFLLSNAATNDNADRDLVSLYKGAAQLALILWGQRAFMTCRRLPELPPFKIADEGMAAHRLHHLDEDDTRLDGKRGLLLLQPAVLAWGSEDAEHYDQCKVWAPAVMLLDSK